MRGGAVELAEELAAGLAEELDVPGELEPPGLEDAGGVWVSDPPPADDEPVVPELVEPERVLFDDPLLE